MAGDCSITCEGGCACLATTDGKWCKCICSRSYRFLRRSRLFKDNGLVIFSTKGMPADNLALMLEARYPGGISVPAVPLTKKFSEVLSGVRLRDIPGQVGLTLGKNPIRPAKRKPARK